MWMPRRRDACDDEGGTMAGIIRQALGPLGTMQQCPFCRKTNILWYGILRVCGGCAHVFHWRDAVTES